MGDKDNPCKPDCPRRSWDCHSKCKDYAIYHAAKLEEYAETAKKSATPVMGMEQDRARRVEKYRKKLNQ